MPTDILVPPTEFHTYHQNMLLEKNPPESIGGPSAWIGEDLANQEASWLINLTQRQIDELEAAAHHYLSLGKDVGEITADQFPVEHCAELFESLKHTLLRGHGIQVLRGLPVQQYTQVFNAAIFCGIGAHLGSARSQNGQGHILGHVRNIGKSSTDPNARIYQTAERQSFHTDSADVVALLCLREARKGGRSLLVSAETIYNRMRKQRPDLTALLFEPIATDRRGEIPPGAKAFMEIPILSWHAGHLTVFYQRQYIESAQRFSDAPRLTEKHIEALDLFDSLANDPQLNLSMQLQTGDMQFVYNHSQLHDRTSFEDWPDPTRRRHLFRLWLSLPEDRELPESFKQRYGSIQVGDRGGIITEHTSLHVPLD